MTTIIEAIYEGGMFRPVEKVDLKEGTHVEVRVPQVTSQRNCKEVAAKLGRLAAMATRKGSQETTARDHDQILYGEKQCHSTLIGIPRL
jgi:predicted DNA-binding antitoxin AbrB/MazE fold protein